MFADPMDVVSLTLLPVYQRHLTMFVLQIFEYPTGKIHAYRMVCAFDQQTSYRCQVLDCAFKTELLLRL